MSAGTGGGQGKRASTFAGWGNTACGYYPIGQIRGSGTDEKLDKVGCLLGVTDLRVDAVPVGYVGGLFVQHVFYAGREGHAGFDGVDADVVFRPLVSHRSRRVRDSGLRGT